jgi:hypothetical protein
MARLGRANSLVEITRDGSKDGDPAGSNRRIGPLIGSGVRENRQHAIMVETGVGVERLREGSLLWSLLGTVVGTAELSAA